MSTEEEEPIPAAAAPNDGDREAENGKEAAATAAVEAESTQDAPSSGDGAPSPPVDEARPSEADESSPPAAAAAASASELAAPAEIPENNDYGEERRQVVVAPLPLDWTKMGECDELDRNPANVVRYPWDVAEIDPNDTHLTLVGTHGQKNP